MSRNLTTLWSKCIKLLVIAWQQWRCKRNATTTIGPARHRWSSIPYRVDGKFLERLSIRKGVFRKDERIFGKFVCCCWRRRWFIVSPMNIKIKNSPRHTAKWCVWTTSSHFTASMTRPDTTDCSFANANPSRSAWTRHSVSLDYHRRLRTVKQRSAPRHFGGEIMKWTIPGAVGKNYTHPITTRTDIDKNIKKWRGVEWNTELDTIG